MNNKQTLLISTLLILGFSLFIVSQPAAALECSILPKSICDASNAKDLGSSGTWLLLKWVIGILTALIGIVAVGMIAFASFLYTTAGGNKEQAKKSIEMIRNVVIALIIFALMWAVLNWIVPGGIFG